MAMKERLDVLLVQQGHFDSRETAKKAIMAGLVFVAGERVDKAGTKVLIDAGIEVKGKPHPYVGRGGLKLERAIQEFALDLTNQVMLDIGASTGGFTDCALQNGAAYVYAIDVGYNQLSWKLRQDPRVNVMERTNFRYLTQEELVGPTPTFASIDVSFISLNKILPALYPLLSVGARVVALVKPQFEAGKEQVGNKGIVRDASIHQEVLEHVIQMALQESFSPLELTYSPITGGDGNIEFLLLLEKAEKEQGTNLLQPTRIQQEVMEAHQELS
ncbi:TlyA family RNA methyltransferase [Rubeoparvulum massiliense]|uniref:TlyA family RNA methyltransferase n=1 Tax=Rubeoparvulum massiliense TaxID=1631346 RepID=UPI00065DF078|nr:TlyA family RNA methyltransferase [Rubeoparvulum massiliense]